MMSRFRKPRSWRDAGRDAAWWSAVLVGLVAGACAPDAPGRAGGGRVDSPKADTARPVPFEGPPRSVGGIPNPCFLIDAATIRRITGLDFDPGQVTGARDNMRRCGWTRANARSASADTLSLVLYAGNVDALASQYAAAPGAEVVPGIGNAAWWRGTTREFAVRRGEDLVVIVFGFGDANARRWGEAIAWVVLGNL